MFTLGLACCRGMPPTEADLRYLESAKRLAFYGVDLHKAKVGFSHGQNVHVQAPEDFSKNSEQKIVSDFFCL